MTGPRQMKPEEMEKLLNEGLRPHAPELAVIGFSGDVVVVIFKPGEGATTTARAIGWDGTSPLFRLSAEGKKALLESAPALDPRLGKWLQRKFDPAAPIARILVLTGNDTVLVNYHAFQGWFLEPEAEKATPVN